MRRLPHWAPWQIFHQLKPLEESGLKMHTALTRANALAAYTMSVLASLTFLCFLSTFFNEYQVTILVGTWTCMMRNLQSLTSITMRIIIPKLTHLL